MKNTIMSSLLNSLSLIHSIIIKKEYFSKIQFTLIRYPHYKVILETNFIYDIHEKDKKSY